MPRKKPKKVWVVTSGDYSSYTLRAVCATKEVADAYYNAKPDYFDVDDFILEETPPIIYEVITYRAIWRNHNRSEPPPRINQVVGDIDPHPVLDVNHSKVDVNNYFLYASGTDLERVGKVFTERKAMIQATYDTTGKWPPNYSSFIRFIRKEKFL